MSSSSYQVFNQAVRGLNSDDVFLCPFNDLDLCLGQAVQLIDQGIHGAISGFDLALELFFFQAQLRLL